MSGMEGVDRYTVHFILCLHHEVNKTSGNKKSPFMQHGTVAFNVT